MVRFIKKYEYDFLKYPRALYRNGFFSQLSNDAKTLFAFILDRSGLSEINSDRFTDSDGRAFVYFTIDEICSRFGCGTKKAVGIIQELERFGLISKKRAGCGKPTRLTVSKFAYSLIESDKPLVEKTNECCQNDNSEVVKSTIQNLSKGQGINTEKNNNDIINTDPSTAYKRVVEEVEEQIEFDCISGDADIVRELVLIMADVLTTPAATVRISGVDLPTSVVADRYRLIRAEHIESIVYDINNSGKKIMNMHSFIMAKLYYAPTIHAVSETAEYAFHTRNR